MYKKLLLKVLLSIFALLNFKISTASHVDTITIESKIMNKSHQALIILPDSYQETTDNFPVIYLLHGYTDNFSTYLSKIPELRVYADNFQCIIICPDGGYSSWYIDSPFDMQFQYASYIGKEVPEYVDVHYRTIKNKKGRAITGHSMGGHGALLMAIFYPETFGAAGSMSGGVKLDFKTTSWHIPKRVGSYQENKENWIKNSVYHQIDKLKAKETQIIIDCGTGDFFYGINTELHKKMLSLKIPHDYIERPGEHSWQYWKNSIKYQIQFFSDFFKDN